METHPDLIRPYPLTQYPRLIINAALTGMVAKRKDSAHVPLSPEEIIEDAARCRDAGASIVHLHARDKEEKPAYEKRYYSEIIEGVRDRCPDLIVCASTSGRVHNTFARRSDVLTLTGRARPDMASLTLGSLNFPKSASVTDPDMIRQLAEKMKEAGIVPELEVFDTSMLYTMKEMIRTGILTPPFYCNLLLGSVFSTPATLFNLACLVKDMPYDTLWAAAGIGIFQLKMNTAAILMGGHVRVGLEDSLYYDAEKTKPATNPGLVERIARLAKELGREIATPTEARQMIGLCPATA
ncbi:MAG: 3-keto-5-aminohexanoate cleavage protein [Thermodesulfobacteriota bacterium]